jgi:integrase
MPKLTNSRIDQTKPSDKELYLWDSTQPGLGLRVYPSGRKVFIYQYRLKTGQTRKKTIGRYPAVTPHKAKVVANELAGKVFDGEDPSGERHDLKKSTSLEELCNLYLSEGCSHKKASTIDTDVGRIKRHIVPLLGQKPVAQISRDDIAIFISDVSAGKTATNVKTSKLGGRAIVTGGEGAASRTVGLLGGILSFGIQKGLRDDNPVRGAKKPKDAKRERFLSDEELNRLWRFLQNPTGLTLNPNAIPAVTLLLLTGARKSEVTCLEWGQVDTSKGYLDLPESKTGRKKIPLNQQAVDILEKIPRISSNPNVFTSGEGGKYVSLQKDWSKIRRHLNMADVRLHDLRHSFASILAAQGQSLFQIGQILGHSDPKTTQIYAHLVDEQSKKTVEGLGDFLAGMGGAEDVD